MLISSKENIVLNSTVSSFFFKSMICRQSSQETLNQYFRFEAKQTAKKKSGTSKYKHFPLQKSMTSFS